MGERMVSPHPGPGPFSPSQGCGRWAGPRLCFLLTLGDHTGTGRNGAAGGRDALRGQSPHLSVGDFETRRWGEGSGGAGKGERERGRAGPTRAGRALNLLSTSVSI